MTEILFGIRVLKYYNWEEHFTQKIAEARKKELHHLKVLKYLDAVCVYTWAALPVVISILTFITYVLLGNNLTAAKVCRSHFKGLNWLQYNSHHIIFFKCNIPQLRMFL